MITTIERSRISRLRRKAAFTLVEGLIGVTLMGLVLSIATGSLVFMAKSSHGMGNYQEMNTSSRFLLEQFASDARMTEDVNFASSSSVSLEVYDAAGGTSAVVYDYDSAAGTFTRTEGGSTRTILRDLTNLELTYYTLHSVGGEATTNPAAIKEMQLEATMVRKTLRADNTNYILSARFMMRNKSVAN